MTEFFRDGGLIMYPLFAVTVAVIGYSVAAARGLRSASGPDARLEATIDGVLFWGGFGVVLGVIGSLIGIVVAAQAIEAAGGVADPGVGRDPRRPDVDARRAARIRSGRAGVVRAPAWLCPSLRNAVMMQGRAALWCLART
jgi:hypothetical protein